MKGTKKGILKKYIIVYKNIKELTGKLGELKE